MKALILSAGRGRRLWPYTADAPKCLLPVGDVDILGNQLESFAQAGVTEVVLICGHGLHKVRRRLASLPEGIEVRLLFNPFFAMSDNLVSLWAARSEMDQDFILSNGDNLIHPRMLSALVDAEGDCCVLAQRKGTYGTDDMKVQVDGNRITRINKSLPPSETDAESVGIIRFSAEGATRMRRALEEVLTERAAMRRFFVDAIQHLIDQGHHVNWVDTGGLPWLDVDTIEDLEFARRNFPRLFTSASPTAIEDRW